MLVFRVKPNSNSHVWLSTGDSPVHMWISWGQILQVDNVNYWSASNTTKGIKCQVLTLASAMLICD